MRSRRRSDARLVDGDVDELDPFYGRLDINAATAEELMTLPGVNRATATNVVMYRAQIGGFRKVEDMALVPGVGATRFGHVRAEIYVADAPQPPRASTTLRRSGSSATSSGIDVSLTPADSVSREFVAGSGVQTTSGVGDDIDTDTCLRPDASVNSRVGGSYDAAVDRDRLTTTTDRLRHRGRSRPTWSDARRRRPEYGGVVRVATWNLRSCSLNDLSARRLVAATLLHNW